MFFPQGNVLAALRKARAHARIEGLDRTMVRDLRTQEIEMGVVSANQPGTAAEQGHCWHP